MTSGSSIEIALHSDSDPDQNVPKLFGARLSATSDAPSKIEIGMSHSNG